MASGRWHQWETLFSADLPHYSGTSGELERDQWWVGAVGSGDRSGKWERWGAGVGTVGSRSGKSGKWELYDVVRVGSGTSGDWDRWEVGG